MAILRIFLVSLLAAVFGCALASLAVFGSALGGGFVGFPFTVMGSFLLLATGYGAARQTGLPLPARYARLMLIGAVGGALMLALIFVLGDPLLGALIGAVYGTSTAVCWIVFHFFARQLSFRGS